MKADVRVLSSNELYSFLFATLPYYSFSLYMHILTEPYISLLTSLPAVVRGSSEVYLDGEKRSINSYAVRRLSESGYSVYYVDRLHGKVAVIGSRPEYLVVGTSNLTLRSFSNYEVVVVFERPPRGLYESLASVFIEKVKSSAYRARAAPRRVGRSGRRSL